jgi:hypothetical protein
MTPSVAPRRAVLQALVSAIFGALGWSRPASGGTPSAGTSVTWTYRWRAALAAPHPAPRPRDLPAEFVPVGDHRAHATQHWVRPRDWPLGPAVQSRHGEIISVDFMVAQADFERGFSWTLEIPEPLRQRAVDHVDIDFVPRGHTGFEAPHYDIHLYFVPHGAHGACEM